MKSIKTSSDLTSLPLQNRKNKNMPCWFLLTQTTFTSPLKCLPSCKWSWKYFLSSSEEEWQCRLPSNWNWYFIELGKIQKGGPPVPIRNSAWSFSTCHKVRIRISASTPCRRMRYSFLKVVCQIKNSRDSVTLFCRK